MENGDYVLAHNGCHSEPNFIADLDADWCDRHETPFRMGERCPKCVAEFDADSRT